MPGKAQAGGMMAGKMMAPNREAEAHQNVSARSHQ
jgi:hypothetical protein